MAKFNAKPTLKKRNPEGLSESTANSEESAVVVEKKGPSKEPENEKTDVDIFQPGEKKPPLQRKDDDPERKYMKPKPKLTATQKLIRGSRIKVIVVLGVICGIVLGMSIASFLQGQTGSLEDLALKMVDCTGEWNQWSPCSLSCGLDGTRTRVFTVSREAKHGGRECGNENGAKQASECIEVPCPDCVGQWSDYSECSKSCGTGQKTRTFSVQVPGTMGGESCDANKGDIEQTECNKDSCPIDCKFSWADWSECSQTCGGGEKARKFSINIVPMFHGDECPHEPGFMDQVVCNSNACPIDCIGSWSDYSQCSTTCGVGVKSRTFEVRRQAMYSGTACESEAHAMTIDQCRMPPCGLEHECEQMVNLLFDNDPNLDGQEDDYLSTDYEEFSDDLEAFPQVLFKPILSKKLCTHLEDRRVKTTGENFNCVENASTTDNDQIQLNEFLLKNDIEIKQQIIEISNGMVGDNGEVYSCHFAIIGDGCHEGHDVKNQYLVDWSRTDLETYDTIIALSDYTIGDSIHIWTDELARLSTYVDIMDESEDMDVRVHMRSSKTAVQFFQFLGLNEHIILPNRDHVRAEKILIPQGVPCGAVNFVAQNKLSQHLRERLQVKSEQNNWSLSDQIVINLGTKSEKRGIRNLSVFEKKLNKKLPSLTGVDFIWKFDAEAHSHSMLEEVAKVFWKAKVLISTTNEYITNMIFMEPGTVVIELFCSKHQYDIKNSHLAYYLGLRYYGFHYKGPCHAGVKIKPNEIIKLLEHVLNRTE